MRADDHQDNVVRLGHRLELGRHTQGVGKQLPLGVYRLRMNHLVGGLAQDILFQKAAEKPDQRLPHRILLQLAVPHPHAGDHGGHAVALRFTWGLTGMI